MIGTSWVLSNCARMLAEETVRKQEAAIQLERDYHKYTSMCIDVYIPHVSRKDFKEAQLKHIDKGCVQCTRRKTSL